MMRSVSRYCSVVEEEVKSTHVVDVATAVEGSMPIVMKNGEKIRPPPMPTMPARAPVTKAMTSYFKTVLADHPSYLTREPL
mmetsp:Transcript_90943/g.236925  ORF Transcript_90943/g.236925 Transcript_90943/m.236925 type:complete len:81 (-) Transcript_90943:1197-1439(-)